MITYSFLDGVWRAQCSVCGTYITSDSVTDIHRRGKAHAKVCGR